MSVEAYPNLWVLLAIIAMGVMFIIFTLAVVDETESFEENLRIISETPKG